MMNQELWEKVRTLGTLQRQYVFLQRVDNKSFALKPMNCPGHMLMFKNKLHSYRELPIVCVSSVKCIDMNFSGALNGLLRVRNFLHKMMLIYL